MTTPFTPGYAGNYYDTPSAVMIVNQGDMLQASNAATAAAKNVSDSVQRIATLMKNLALSWVGQSSADATMFTNQWNSAMDAFFGSTTTPGALDQLLMAVANAGNNYAMCEGALRDSFQQLADQLEASLQSTATGMSPPQSSANHPITETF